jgi:hypothetical protein
LGGLRTSAAGALQVSFETIAISQVRIDLRKKDGTIGGKIEHIAQSWVDVAAFPCKSKVKKSLGAPYTPLHKYPSVLLRS